MQRRADDSPWRILVSPLIVVFGILLIALLVYAPHLNDWFFADDFGLLRGAQTTSWSSWFAEAFDFRSRGPVPAFEHYRPLYVLTFKAEFSLFHVEPLGYHAVNIGVHLLNVVLLWLIAHRLTARPGISHFVAFVFAIHPAYGDAVAWISAGNAVMATFFYLLTFLLFMKTFDDGIRRAPFLVLSLATFLVALLFHPVTATMAVVLPAWYFLLYRRLRDLREWRDWLQFAPIVLFLVPYLGIQMWVRGENPGQQAAFNLGGHIFANYFHYPGIAFYPTPDDSGIRVGASIAVILLTVVLLLRWRTSPLAVFCVFWFYTSLAPNAVFAPGSFGRLFYLPGLSFAFLLGVAAIQADELAIIQAFRQRFVPQRRVVVSIALFALLPATLGYMWMHDSASKTFPWDSLDNTIEKQASANQEFITDLRAEMPFLPEQGTLIVASPPLNLVFFSDAELDSLVELYYGDATVKFLYRSGFSSVLEAEENMGSSDRLFEFHRDR